MRTLLLIFLCVLVAFSSSLYSQPCVVDEDCPDDGNECTISICGPGNTCTTVNRLTGEACLFGFCDGFGNCVECIEHSHCDDGNPGTTDVCVGFLCENDIVVPVRIEYLRVKNYDHTQVTLEWSTTSESNNQHFEIERSPDGKNWSSIILVNGMGTTTKRISYFGIDKNPISGMNYYRLKQVDLNSNFTYSEILQVNISSGHDLIYPSPTHGVLYVENSLQKISQIRVYDQMGRNLKNKISFDQREENKVELDLSDLVSGIYFITINNRAYKVQKL